MCPQASYWEKTGMSEAGVGSVMAAGAEPWSLVWKAEPVCLVLVAAGGGKCLHLPQTTMCGLFVCIRKQNSSRTCWQVAESWLLAWAGASGIQGCLYWYSQQDVPSVPEG